MLKDANGKGEVVAPIFHYRNFERLEHEGQQLLRERRKASQEKGAKPQRLSQVGTALF